MLLKKILHSINLPEPQLSLRVFLSRLSGFLLVVVATTSSIAQKADELPAQKDTLGIKFKKKGSSILDDSTKYIYGPNTTLSISEQDIFINRKKYLPVDTSVNNYHRWTYVQRFNNFYQDLGNVGTALNPIFPQLPSLMGATSGFKVYQPYFDTQEPRYFDTKSPYTRMRLVWGGFGRAMTEIEFSRNINPRWNFGFNYRPILVDKQLQRQRKGDRQTISHYYDIYTNYRTENDRYQIILNYRRIRHRVNEMGGVTIVGADSTYQALFSPDNRPLLEAASSVDQRNQGHLFHQYKLGKVLQIYHLSDVGKQIDQYKDGVSNYYDNIVGVDTVNTTTASDSTWFSYWSHELGVKGSLGKIFYNGYVKSRSVKFRYKYITEDTLALPFNDLEIYFGGRVSFEYDSASHLLGALELLDNGNYDVSAELNSPWLDARARRVFAKPPYIYNTYRGTFDLWNNNFQNTESTQVQAFLKGKFGPLVIAPGGTYTLYNNNIFFRKDSIPDVNQTVLPYQSSGTQQLLSPELRLDLNFLKRFHLRPQLVYSVVLSNADSVLRVPEIFTNTQLTYERIWPEKNFEIQFGVDLHWKSAYQALGYDPAIQQFYLQGEITSPAFLLADVFLNGKMKRGRFFLKYHNILQALTLSGHLPTPIYPGQRNILDFGFELLLFD